MSLTVLPNRICHNILFDCSSCTIGWSRSRNIVARPIGESAVASKVRGRDPIIRVIFPLKVSNPEWPGMFVFSGKFSSFVIFLRSMKI
jgi:hypothetical protein